MKRYGSTLLLAVFLLMSMVSGSVLAQGDPDGDGVFGTKDACPNVAGPASNKGCPLPQESSSQEQPLHPPGDSDGDGTLDEKDKCLLDGGPSWNDGCPTDQTAPPQSTPQVVLPTMPTSGPCMVATAGQASVNVRAMPSATSAIVGVLNPADLYPVFATFTGDDGLWYLVKTGWSAGSVLRTGGLCDTLPSFDFGDVLLNFADGPGDGMILNVMPVPDGQPFITLNPFAPGGQSALNFTKVDDDFPDAGFSFLLIPFPGDGSSDNAPEDQPDSPAANVFEDGYIRGMMGDGSVFIMMPPGLQGDDNPLNGILIGLSQPDVDPAGILIGLSQPTLDPTKILIGLNQPSAVNGDQVNTYGILIGMLLPAVQVGDADVNPAGILIGLLQPSIEGSQNQQFGFSRDPFGGEASERPAGGSGATFPPSVQGVFDMGLNFLVPGAGAPTKNTFTAGWGVDFVGIGIPTE